MLTCPLFVSNIYSQQIMLDPSKEPQREIFRILVYVLRWIPLFVIFFSNFMLNIHLNLWLEMLGAWVIHIFSDKIIKN